MPNIAFGNMRRPSAREGWGMQGELAKGFVVIYFSLSKKWSGHNINVTLTPETQIARDETVVQTIDATNRCDISSRQRGGEYCFCQILWAKED